MVHTRTHTRKDGQKRKEIRQFTLAHTAYTAAINKNKTKTKKYLDIFIAIYHDTSLNPSGALIRNAFVFQSFFASGSTESSASDCRVAKLFSSLRLFHCV